MSPQVTLTLKLDMTFPIECIWPDGDVPAEITAEAVKAVMESCGDKRRVLDEWCLTDCLEVTVLVNKDNPHRTQDEVLFGDPPPKRIEEVVQVWD